MLRLHSFLSLLFVTHTLLILLPTFFFHILGEFLLLFVHFDLTHLQIGALVFNLFAYFFEQLLVFISARGILAVQLLADVSKVNSKLCQLAPDAFALL